MAIVGSRHFQLDLLNGKFMFYLFYVNSRRGEATHEGINVNNADPAMSNTD